MKRAFVIACALSAASCASTPEPREELARAKAALEEAERGGGPEHAELEMSLAREKLAAAEKSTDSEPDEARRSAEQAEVDARLALVKARRAEAEQATQELGETVRAMSEEMQNDPL
jgi:hypothetical protein